MNGYASSAGSPQIEHYICNMQTSHRHLIVISDTAKHCIQIAKNFTAKSHTLWLSDQHIDNETPLAISKATTVLGQEFQMVVFNAHTDSDNKIAFDANAFGAVIGTLVGGGYLLLLIPESTQWVANSRFLQRFLRLLTQFSIPFYHQKKRPPPALIPPILPVQSTQLNDEQQQVFNAMLRVMNGHRRRPLVLTSDRGRGKSTLLGKFAAHLLQQGVQTILITAPSRKIANTLLHAATIALGNSNKASDLPKRLHFLSPDALHQHKPSADLVLVDEAASIPLPILATFVKHYSRLIFATTEHGYEGSGRGFAIRFRAMLDTLCPHWNAVYLKKPFRWGENDPLEKFSFDLLLLNADIADLKTFPASINKQSFLAEHQIERIYQDQLVENETLLREIFGLLLSAHYQTKPSDLVRLLDQDNYQLFILRYKTHLLASVLVAQEGGFNAALAEEIYYGNRRPHGHLIPQLLATHVGIKKAPCYSGDRIMRITVHPKVQGQGLGSHLLHAVIQHSRQQNKADYIATSFGATPALISFWYRAGFQSIQIGMKRDASSATHSIIMLHPFTPMGQSLLIQAYSQFQQSFPLLLADPLRDLEAPLVVALSKPLIPYATQEPLRLNSNEQHALYGFAYQQRGYESSITVIYKLTLYYLNHANQSMTLTTTELQVLIAKVLQKKNWQTLVQLSKLNGRKQAIKILKKTVQKLAYPYLKDY